MTEKLSDEHYQAVQLGACHTRLRYLARQIEHATRTGRRPNPAHLAAIDEIKQRIADLKAGRLGPPTQVAEGSPR